jgi:hypothetical protein
MVWIKINKFIKKTYMGRRTISGLNYEQNEYEFKLELHKLQKHNFELQQINLTLSNKQLKRQYLHSIISFMAGIISAIIVHIYTKDTKDIERLEQRIIIAEQTVNQMKDSTRNAKVLSTNPKDSLIYR